MSDKDLNDKLDRLCNELQAVTEQLRLIKIFAAAAVAFLGPLLIASIYGMNFKHMPELEWPWGYGMAIALMLSVALSIVGWFRHKKWL